MRERLLKVFMIVPLSIAGCVAKGFERGDRRTDCCAYHQADKRIGIDRLLLSGANMESVSIEFGCALRPASADRSEPAQANIKSMAKGLER